MSTCRIRSGVLAFAMVFAGATFVKSIYNAIFSHMPPRPCSTSEEARSKGVFVGTIDIAPKIVAWQGKRVSFAEGWVEEAVDTEYRLVWFSFYRRLGYYYLCFTLAEGQEIFREQGHPFFVLADEGSSFAMRHYSGSFLVFCNSSETLDAFPASLSLLSSWRDERRKNISFVLKK